VVGRPWLVPALILAMTIASVSVAWAHARYENARLPVVGPAPQFALTAESGERVTLSDLRGKVLAVTFIYATCTDTCPLLTAKMVEIQRRLGRDFGPLVQFVSITVDPEVDTPAVLRAYAREQGANVDGWRFLTGTPVAIADVLRRYGIFARKSDRGGVDHLLSTSLIDRTGMLRVQYLGVRFDPGEMYRDLQTLLRE
jgi:protein SCO1/2